MVNSGAIPALASDSAEARRGPPTHRRHWRWWPPLYVQVLIGMAAGIAVGHFFPATGATLKPVSDIFVHLLKMLIEPVIFCSVINGIASAGSLGQVGRVGGKALVWFEVATTGALLVGLLAGHLLQPGAGLNIDIAALDPALVQTLPATKGDSGFIAFILRAIPHSFVGALSGGDPLQTLLIASLAGVAYLSLGETGVRIQKAAEVASALFFRLVGMITCLAPLGAFGGMAFTIDKYGIGELGSLAWLIGAFYLTAAVFVFVILGVVCRLCGFSIFRLVAYLRTEFLIVLGASSVEPVLPHLMRKMQKLGAEQRVVALVTPTGYSFNMDGTCIYITLAVIFLSQATNIHLGLGQQLMIIGVAMLTSKGATGVTGSGFVTLAATLSVIPDIPVAALAIIVGIDRFMSECRALTSFAGNAVANLVVAKWEGALDMERLRAGLAMGPDADGA